MKRKNLYGLRLKTNVVGREAIQGLNVWLMKGGKSECFFPLPQWRRLKNKLLLGRHLHLSMLCNESEDSTMQSTYISLI